MSMFEIDYTKFDVGVVNVIRKARLDRINLGTTLDGVKHYKTKGVYYDYEITINTRRMNVADYDKLYELITTPVDYYMVTVPYGQESKTFKAVVSVNDDSIIQNYSKLRKWGSLKIIIEALEPEKVASYD